MADIKYRAGNVNDAEGIAKAHIDTWRECYKGIVADDYLDSLDLEKRTAGWKEGLSSIDQYNFVAERDGQIIGWATYGINRDDRADDICEIFGIYVLPEYWGSGVGETLFNLSLEALFDWSPNFVTLWVLEANTRAIKFYEKHGFSFDGTRKIIKVGEQELHELRYQKQLTE